MQGRFDRTLLEHFPANLNQIGVAKRRLNNSLERENRCDRVRKRSRAPRPLPGWLKGRRTRRAAGVRACGTAPGSKRPLHRPSWRSAPRAPCRHMPGGRRGAPGTETQATTPGR